MLILEKKTAQKNKDRRHIYEEDPRKLECENIFAKKLMGKKLETNETKK